MERLQRVNSDALKSRGTTLNSPAGLDSLPVPEPEDAAVIGTIIDLGRGALGWNRLPEKEQDAMVCSFYLELSDEGVPSERWMDCYRAAAKRRRQMQREGKPVGALTAGELTAEWESIRCMHAELDKTRLLPSRARGACSRCFGTGFERMSDGSVRPGCPHDEWTPEDESELERNEEQRRADVARQAEVRREALKAVAGPKPPAPNVQPPPPKGLDYKCDSCTRTLNVLRELDGATCNDLLNRGTNDGELKLCRGTFRRAQLHECRVESCAKFGRRILALAGEVCAACGEGLEVSEV